MFERLVRLLNDENAFKLIEKRFNGTAKLDEYFRLPTLSIFQRRSDLRLDKKIIEPSHEDKPLAKDDS